MGEAIPNTSLAAWVERIEPHDNYLASRIGGESMNPYAVAAGFGLPVPAYRKFDSVESFLGQSDEGLQPLLSTGVTSFYVGGRTTAPGLSGFRNNQPLAAKDIVPFIHGMVAPEHRAIYNVRIAEFLQGLCVVAQIRRDGTIELDIGVGTTLPELTGGRKTPDFIATNERTAENPAGQLRYFAWQGDKSGTEAAVPLAAEVETSVLNTSVRTAIWRGISALPAMTVESDVYVPRLPGRYEFAVVNHNGIDTAIFGDAQPFRKLSVE
ncbi:MAG: hypothetical protein ACHQT5_02105 [Candidatus Saccharimonadales bacterium]|jgi:hypothetical protein